MIFSYINDVYHGNVCGDMSNLLFSCRQSEVTQVTLFYVICINARVYMSYCLGVLKFALANLTFRGYRSEWSKTDALGNED